MRVHLLRSIACVASLLMICHALPCSAQASCWNGSLRAAGAMEKCANQPRRSRLAHTV